jgi:hypothetical protein
MSYALLGATLALMEPSAKLQRGQSAPVPGQAAFRRAPQRQPATEKETEKEEQESALKAQPATL